MEQKFYAVRKGVHAGIYFSWEDLNANIDGFMGVEYKSFDNIEDAKNFILGAAKAAPAAEKAVKAAASKETDGNAAPTEAANKNAGSAKKSKQAGGEAASEAKAPEESSADTVRYYAIKKGRKPGVYTDFKDFVENTYNFAGCKFSVFDNKKEALEYMTGPQPQKKKKKTVYYAVKVGKKPGIYTDYEEATSYIRDFHYSLMRKFKKLSDAEAFMAENIYYAVKIGRKPGIYTNYAEANSNTQYFPHHLMKSFKKLSEAEAFLGLKSQGNIFYAVITGWKPGIYDNIVDVKAATVDFSNPIIKEFDSREKAQAFYDYEISKILGLSAPSKGVDWKIYVDGSFKTSLHRYSCGVIVLKNNEVVNRLSVKREDAEVVKLRNVAAEILGVQTAIQYCRENDIKDVAIYHDCKAVACLANGDWVPQKEETIKYRDFINEARKTINITFHKVKAHSGDTYNEMADELAQKALDI